MTPLWAVNPLPESTKTTYEKNSNSKTTTAHEIFRVELSKYLRLSILDFIHLRRANFQEKITCLLTGATLSFGLGNVFWSTLSSKTIFLTNHLIKGHV